MSIRRLRAACYLGAATSVPMTALMFAPLTPDGHHFRHTADYVLTALGIPTALAALLLLSALRKRARGRLATAGMVLAGIPLALFIPAFAYAVAAGVAGTYGGGYLLATLATDVGIALFAAGAARAGVLPAWLAALWALAWTLGGLLALPGVPLLLGAVYLAIEATVRSPRSAGSASPRRTWPGSRPLRGTR